MNSMEYALKIAALKKKQEDPNEDVRIFMRTPVRFNDDSQLGKFEAMMSANPHGRKRKVAKLAFNNDWRC